MRCLYRSLSLLVVAVLFAGCGGEQAGEPRELRLGMVSIGRAPAEQTFEAVRGTLEQELHIPVRFEVFPDARELLGGYRDGALDIALMSVALYAEVREQPGAIPLVKPAADLNNASVFIARSEDPGRELADFRGRRVVFGPRESSSGYVLPRRFLQREGIDAAQYFGEIIHSSSHLNTLDVLLAGGADLAVVHAAILGDVPPEAVRTIWITPSYIGFLVVAHPALSERTRARARDALLGARADSDETGVPTHFLPASDADFAIYEEP